MRRLNVTNSESGFTLLEQLIVLVLVGILGALTTPSMLGMKQRQELNEAVINLRSSLQEVQRQAIMKSQTCNVPLPSNGTTSPTNISSTCFALGSPNLSKVKITYYPIPSSTDLKFNYRGENKTEGSYTAFTSTIILKHKDNESLGQKCIQISQPLGLVRVGDYVGSTCVAVQ